eukprot:2009335-Pyramimonas_sp.AAC.1
MQSPPLRGPGAHERPSVILFPYSGLCSNGIALLYGSSCTDNGKDALNTPESILLVCCIHLLLYNIALLYGSSCANNGKDALNTPEH